MSEQDDDGTGWRLLLRRAMGIPDIVGSEVADRAIERRMRATNTLVSRDQPVAPTMEGEVLRAVRWAGQTGLLDEWLLELEDAETPAASAIRSRINDRTNWQTTTIWEAIYPMVDYLLAEIRTFVERHPFQDSAGAYFGS